MAKLAEIADVIFTATPQGFCASQVTEGDGYLYQNRSLSDVFVFPNGRDGKVDSVYVDVDTTEYTGE